MGPKLASTEFESHANKTNKDANYSGRSDMSPRPHRSQDLHEAVVKQQQLVLKLWESNWRRTYKCVSILFSEFIFFIS